VSTADLIATGREYAHAGKLPAPAHALILGLADALEAATKRGTFLEEVVESAWASIDHNSGAYSILSAAVHPVGATE